MSQTFRVRIRAKPGKDEEAERLLREALPALMQRAPDLFEEPPAIEASGTHRGTKPAQGERITMQAGSELRIRNNGEIILDNPEVELALEPRAADAVLLYRFDAKAGQHILRLIDPLADHQHLRVHRPDD